MAHVKDRAEEFLDLYDPDRRKPCKASEDALDQIAVSIEATNEAQLAVDPTGKLLDGPDRAAAGLSGPGVKATRERAPRLHVPTGYTMIDGGWLVPSDPTTDADIAIATAVFLAADRAEGYGTLSPETFAALDRMHRRATMRFLLKSQNEVTPTKGGGVSVVDPSTWWKIHLALMLRAECCTPLRYRRTVAQLVADLATRWSGLGPFAPPLPMTLARHLRAVAGERLQRLTPSRRGGGRGRSAAKKSCAQAVAHVADKVRADERDALARFRVLRVLQDEPGLSLRRVGSSGGDPRALRRAYERLHTDGTLDRGVIKTA